MFKSISLSLPVYFCLFFFLSFFNCFFLYTFFLFPTHFFLFFCLFCHLFCVRHYLVSDAGAFLGRPGRPASYALGPQFLFVLVLFVLIYLTAFFFLLNLSGYFRLLLRLSFQTQINSAKASNQVRPSESNFRRRCPCFRCSCRDCCRN